MDTSPEYIAMCRGAEEIQNHVLNKGDYYTFPIKKMSYQPKPEEKVGDYWVPQLWHDEVPIRFGDYAVWLPRQDQLQAMIQLRGIIGYIYQFYRFCDALYANWHKPWPNPAPAEGVKVNLTLEQLWLAFVMQERYGKGWTRTEWVKA